MLIQYKTVLDDLLKYTVDGVHEGLTADGFNGDSYDSTSINNIKYKFIRKYEDVNSITDKNIIPVLIITTPDQYLKGRIMYKGQFIDLRTMLVKEQDEAGHPIKKINFFIIPHFLGIHGHNFGSILYDLKIDYVTEFDIYGFMSKEIDSIMKRHYFKSHMGDYFHLSIDNHIKNLYFVPTNQRIINQESLINRIAQSFEIKFCSIV